MPKGREKNEDHRIETKPPDAVTLERKVMDVGWVLTFARVVGMVQRLLLDFDVAQEGGKGRRGRRSGARAGHRPVI